MNRAFMARAIALSIENVKEGLGGPFATVIARGDEIIAEAGQPGDVHERSDGACGSGGDSGGLREVRDI